MVGQDVAKIAHPDTEAGLAIALFPERLAFSLRHLENRPRVRVVNETTDEELARDDMEEKFERATAVKFCELERVGSEWHFRKLHKPLEKGLREAAESYGCIISSIG